MGRLGAAVHGMGAVEPSIAASSLPGRSSACRPDCFSRISPSSRSARCRGRTSSTWGWRIPFLLSIVLVALGLYIRLGILETPVFARLVAEKPDRANAGPRSAPPPAARDPPDGAVPHGRAGAVLYLHPPSCSPTARACCILPRNFLLTRRARRDRALVRLDSALRASVRPLRAQADLHARRAVTGVYGFAYFALLDTRSAVRWCSSRSCSRCCRTT